MCVIFFNVLIVDDVYVYFTQYLYMYICICICMYMFMFMFMFIKLDRASVQRTAWHTAYLSKQLTRRGCEKHVCIIDTVWSDGVVRVSSGVIYT